MCWIAKRAEKASTPVKRVKPPALGASIVVLGNTRKSMVDPMQTVANCAAEVNLTVKKGPLLNLFVNCVALGNTVMSRV